MKSLNEYLQEQETIIKELQKRFKILKEIEFYRDIKLLVCGNNGNEEFETRNYSLADNVAINPVSCYGMDYQIIDFTSNITTTKGDLTVFCRHDGWHSDEKRYAQASSMEMPYETQRHDIKLLLNFYKEQGVNDKLLKSLEIKIREIYDKSSRNILEMTSEEASNFHS